MSISRLANSQSVHQQSITESSPTCIPDSHPHKVTNTKCPIYIVISSDDGHIVARNM